MASAEFLDRITEHQQIEFSPCTVQSLYELFSFQSTRLALVPSQQHLSGEEHPSCQPTSPNWGVAGPAPLQGLAAQRNCQWRLIYRR